MMMQKIAEGLRNLFTFQGSWTYKGEGHWAAPRRRVRAWVKALGAAGVAGLLALAWMGDSGQKEPEPDVVPAPVAVVEAKKLLVVAPLASPDRLSELPEDATEAAFVPAEGVEILVTELPEDSLEEPPVEAPEKTIPHSAMRIGPNPRPGKGVPAWQRPYWIRVDKGDYALSLYRGQDVVKTYSVAVGQNPGNKRTIGDHRTPVGDFRVVSIEDASRWKHDFGDGKGKIAGAYGPWFIRLDAGGWKGIGIHGTHDPDSRGTMATEGCIRLSNEEIQELRRYAYRGMRVVIEE